jgi:hypothetical protein
MTDRDIFTIGYDFGICLEDIEDKYGYCYEGVMCRDVDFINFSREMYKKGYEQGKSDNAKRI